MKQSYLAPFGVLYYTFQSENVCLFTDLFHSWGSSNQLVPGLRKLKQVERMTLNKQLDYMWQSQMYRLTGRKRRPVGASELSLKE